MKPLEPSFFCSMNSCFSSLYNSTVFSDAKACTSRVLAAVFSALAILLLIPFVSLLSIQFTSSLQLSSYDFRDFCTVSPSRKVSIDKAKLIVFEQTFQFVRFFGDQLFPEPTLTNQDMWRLVNHGKLTWTSVVPPHITILVVGCWQIAAIFNYSFNHYDLSSPKNNGKYKFW